MSTTTLLEQFSRDMADVHASAAASLVQIRRGGRGIGAGTIWSADGLIVTNAHVVEAGGRVSAGLTVALPDGRELPARVLAVDRGSDLAAIKADAHGLATVRRGDSQALAAGEIVIAFGFPYGVDYGATAGTVIESGSAAVEVGSRRRRALVAASLHLRPGHSGGPMVDAQGRLIGINTLMQGPDVGVAVPVHVAEEFVAQLGSAAPRAGGSTDGIAWV